MALVSGAALGWFLGPSTLVLKPLAGAASGVGAVLLGAGPSLAQFAPSLAENPGWAALKA